MSVTLKDVAEHINVSVSTVSRVLNNRDRVHDKTRKRILDAMQELGYVPNEVARSLKKQQTNAIGIIITDIDNNYYSKLITGVESVAYKMGYCTIVCSSMGDVERERAYINMLFSMSISGLILSSVAEETPEIIKQKAESIPIVFVDNMPADSSGCSHISVDNYNESKHIVQMLIASGHKNIGIIEGSSRESSHRERARGFADIIKQAGVNGLRCSGDENESTVEGGYLAAKELLGSQQIDAIFAVNNFTAYGAIKAIREFNLSVPEDISVVCFDADEMELSELKLTCFMQPIQAMGKLAAHIILNKYTGEAVPAQETHTLASTLTIGNSIRSADSDTAFWHGKKNWYFPDGVLAPGQAQAEGQETIAVLNPCKETAKIRMFLYFADRGPIENIELTVPPQRIYYIHMDKPGDLCGVALPNGAKHAIRLRSSIPVIAQYSRMNAPQQAYTTLGYSI